MTFTGFRFDHLAGVLAGTATVAAIVICQPATAKTAKEVAQVAVPTTVRIDSAMGNDYGGSGVIIAKNGKTYTVLTAAHVVKNRNDQYTIYTSKKKTYPIKSVELLQKTKQDPDLAVVKFDSPDDQAVAPVSNSDEASIGSGIYIAGYPISTEAGGDREFEFTAGQITSRPDKRPQGYTMRYDAVTRRGMSGGPVFDVNGRVVGIHGQGDREAGTVKLESGNGTHNTELKTGFNAAIPINTFMGIMSQAGINPAVLSIDNKPADNVAATQPSRQEVRSWEKDFAMGVGIGIIQRVLPIPRIFPF